MENENQNVTILYRNEPNTKLT